jgi:DNA-binding transcriptional LysR family regulator
MRIPLFIVGADLKNGRLVEVLPEWKLAEQGIHAITTAREAPRKTRAFVEFFRAWLGDPPYWQRGGVPSSSG